MRFPVVLLGSVCILATKLTGVSVAEEKTQPNQPIGASPYWAQIETGLAGINLNGTLRLTYTLGESQLLQTLGVHLTLEHIVGVNAYGHAYSTWRINGLRSLISSADRTHLCWQPLAGASVFFEKGKIGRALGDAGDRRWLIREVGDYEYEIRALDARSWRYKQGYLITAEHPILGQIHFLTQGGLVREIRVVDAEPNSPAPVTADYDENARLITLTLSGQSAQRFEWNAEGQLVAWHKSEKNVVKFGYCDGLLVEVAETDKLPQRISWAENLDYGRGDSRWAWPVHLASDESNEYSYKLSAKGFVISRRNRLSQAETVTIYNPRRHRIEQINGTSVLVVTLHKTTSGQSAGIETVTTGTGEILEEYHYDESGHVLSRKRRGEPTRTLSYDESGRLMGLEEGN